MRERGAVFSLSCGQRSDASSSRTRRRKQEAGTQPRHWLAAARREDARPPRCTLYIPIRDRGGFFLSIFCTASFLNARPFLFVLQVGKGRNRVLFEGDCGKCSFWLSLCGEMTRFGYVRGSRISDAAVHRGSRVTRGHVLFFAEFSSVLEKAGVLFLLSQMS